MFSHSNVCVNLQDVEIPQDGAPVVGGGPKVLKKPGVQTTIVCSYKHNMLGALTGMADPVLQAPRSVGLQIMMAFGHAAANSASASTSPSSKACCRPGEQYWHIFLTASAVSGG